MSASPLTPGPELAASVLEYGARGWAVFPCKRLSKKPATAHGVKDARKGPYWLKQYWADHPGGNIGLACGEESGVWALDIDVKDGKPGYETLALLEALFGSLPPTLAQKTPSGGEQRFFTMPADGKVMNSVEKRLGPGLDTRGDGGYVVLPPSIHPDHLTGPRYAWVDAAAPIVKAPDWLLTLLQGGPEELAALAAAVEDRDIPDWLGKRLGRKVAAAPKAAKPLAADRITPYARKALDDECDVVRKTMPGGQNSTLNTAAFKLGGLIATNALPEALVEHHLLAAALGWTIDPRKGGWDHNHLRKIIEQGISAGKQSPREMPPPEVRPGADRRGGSGYGGRDDERSAAAHPALQIDAARSLWAARERADAEPIKALLTGWGVDPVGPAVDAMRSGWPTLGFAAAVPMEMPRRAPEPPTPVLLAALARWSDDPRAAREVRAVLIHHLDAAGRVLLTPHPESGRPVVAKRFIGPWRGAAVRLTPLFCDRLILAANLPEGLRVASTRRDYAVWAVGHAAALAGVILPETAREVVIIGHDEKTETERDIAAGLSCGGARLVRFVHRRGGGQRQGRAA
jgi:hypothetical protein